MQRTSFLLPLQSALYVMEKTFLTLILLVNCSVCMIGAEENAFVNESKVWHWKDGMSQDKFFYFKGDTVINNIPAKKMYLKIRDEFYQAALYENGNKVYCCREGQNSFKLLYDFGANKGDEISSDGRLYTVEDVEEILVNNEVLRVLHISLISYSIKYTFTWVEGFGSISYSIDIIPFYADSQTFIDCRIDDKVLLERKDIPIPTIKESSCPNPKWVGSIWSYYEYNGEEYSFFRYTVLDRPETIDGLTYYPLVKYATCEYEEGKEDAIFRIRQEGEKIFIRKDDFKKVLDFCIPATLKDIGNDYILYDFSLNKGDEYCTLSDVISINVRGTDEIQVDENKYIKRLKFVGPYSGEIWIAGIGSTYDLLEPFTYVKIGKRGRTLNYFCSADSSVIYRMPKNNSAYENFKEDDCSLNPSKIKEVMDCSPIYIKAYNSKIHCTAPDAVKMEVYTMDAVKVGEARFTHGQAEVKVNNTPATYLYIVTYPDGRRESGKVIVKGEG